MKDKDIEVKIDGEDIRKVAARSSVSRKEHINRKQNK